MPVLLGVLASVFIGVSDYYGRYCARRAHAMTAVGTAFIGGLGVTAVLLYFVPSTIGYEALVLGAVSGALMAVALSAMWHSMAISSAAVASPIVAAFTALGPLVYGLATGERPSRIVAAGIALAIVGLLAAVIVPDLGGRLRAGIAFAVLAGACLRSSDSTSGQDQPGQWYVAGRQSTAGGLGVDAGRHKSDANPPDAAAYASTPRFDRRDVRWRRDSYVDCRIAERSGRRGRGRGFALPDCHHRLGGIVRRRPTPLVAGNRHHRSPGRHHPDDRRLSTHV